MSQETNRIMVRKFPCMLAQVCTQGTEETSGIKEGLHASVKEQGEMALPCIGLGRVHSFSHALAFLHRCDLQSLSAPPSLSPV